MQRRNFLRLLPIAIAGAALSRSDSTAAQPDSQKLITAYGGQSVRGEVCTTNYSMRSQPMTLAEFNETSNYLRKPTTEVRFASGELMIISEGRVDNELRSVPYEFTCATCLQPVDEKHEMHASRVLLDEHTKEILLGLGRPVDTSRVFSLLNPT